MISRYRKTVRALLTDLRRFEASPEDFAILGSLQDALYKKICVAEKAKKRIQAELTNLAAKKRHARLSKGDAVDLKNKIKLLDSQAKSYDQILILLKSIGDGIAFTLFDKWDLKPLFFKEGPGHMHQKAGVKTERRMLHAAIGEGVAAVHCDITNVLRYGDICIRIGNFPYLVEVKSSNNRNSRVVRQVENLRKLREYFETDEIEGLYGAPKVTRVAPSTQEVEYSQELNGLLARSVDEKIVWKQVEPGLIYAVCRAFEEGVFDAMVGGMRKPILGILNQYKFTGEWCSYRPYVISIRDLDRLMEFIEGKITIVVVYDNEIVLDHARRKGYDVEPINRPIQAPPNFMSADLWIYKFMKHGTRSADAPTFLMSSHFMGRALLEFVSIEWLVSATVENVDLALATQKDPAQFAL